jgi:hypothetical protein
LTKDHHIFSAYPPTDRVVRNHLALAPGTLDETACKEYIRSFLSALFASAHLQALKLFPEGKKESYESMVMAFYDFFAIPEQREAFYAAVVQKAGKGSESVWDSFNKLEDCLKKSCSKWPPAAVCPLLVSIDEVHFLYTHRTIDSGSDYTLYSLMKSVLNEGISCGLGVITLSTASHITSLAPSKEVAPSMRERSDERILPAPFTELPFDVYAIAKPLIPGRETLATVGSLEYTAKFGRPL